MQRIYNRGKFREGDLVVLWEEKRKHLIKLEKDKIFFYNKGSIPHNDIIGKEEGSVIYSSHGGRIIAFRPTFSDYILEMPRGAQIIYPKDIGIILIWADIFPGAKIIEAGIGSGALTIALLQAVGEEGLVVSYEIREDFANRAMKNIHNFLLEPKNHVLKLKNIYEEIEEEDFDRLILDLPEPWRVVPHAVKALRPGGIFLAYTPTIIQAQKTVEALKETKQFVLIDTFETLLRPWQIEDLSVRPFHRMVAHTAFITLARKLHNRIEENKFQRDDLSEEEVENQEHSF
ncbi:MAG: tRNA (adenine-N1)-methyltransferase [Dictyoglomus sp. NZ13-RE01]|nr:MAG: tRNA (adenine-N1)-methyltransferase [Dictyoglomus sp. NZ13-RE01]